MKNKALTLMISAILCTSDPAFAMERKGEETPNSPIMQPLLSHENKELSIDLNNLPSVPIDIKAESPKERKISKTLPYKRRKSSGSPRVGVNSAKSISPKQTTLLLKDQSKDSLSERKKPAGSSEEEKKDSPRRILINSQGEKNESPRPTKRYSMLGPMRDLPSLVLDISQMGPNGFPKDAEQDSPGREGAASPMRQSREPVL